MVRSTPIAPPATPLTDGSVVLRPRREDDLDAIAAASRDPETLRWLDDPPMDAEARRTGMSRVEEAWRSGRAAPLTIADAATDQAVGVINLQFRTEDVAAVAYSVFPACRGQGIAPRAVLLAVDWALRDLGVTQLVLETDEVNRASIRVAEKCGFRAIDTRSEPRSDGGVRTTIVFARSIGQIRPLWTRHLDQHTLLPRVARSSARTCPAESWPAPAGASLLGFVLTHQAWAYGRHGAFVGREGELSRLQSALAERARLVLVVGDAGIAKTRFVAEALARASVGGMVAVGGGCLPLVAEQVAWESRHLRLARAILFWFPASTSVQPIALYELGWCVASAKPLAVGAEPGYPRRRDVILQLSSARAEIAVRSTLAETVADLASHER